MTSLSLSHLCVHSMDGRSVFLSSYSHFLSHRVLCRAGLCHTSFCTACLSTPYHLGLNCSEYKEWLASPRCRFCLTSAVTKKNKMFGTPPAKALENVCADEECGRKSRGSCLRTFDDAAVSASSSSSHADGCGARSCVHFCRGIRSESFCLPCLDPSCVSASPALTLGVNAHDTCPICFTEELGQAPCVQLASCGHIAHVECLMKRIESNWTGESQAAGALNSGVHALMASLGIVPSPALAAAAILTVSDPRIHFSFLSCPLCCVRLSHPSLSLAIEPYTRFEERLCALAGKTFLREGLSGHEKFKRFKREMEKKREATMAQQSAASSSSSRLLLAPSSEPPVSIEASFALEHPCTFFLCGILS